MSRVPSNAEQFMGGMQMGAQNLQGARENWAIKQQDLRARQGLQLERDKMAQQGQQFRMGLQAEAENYRKLNESRERMQGAEMEQQGRQFDARMAFDKQQSDIDKAIQIKMAQIQNEREMNEKAIQALAKGDPRVAQYRARRRELETEKGQLESMAASTQAALTMLTSPDGVHKTKFNDISTRLATYTEALTKRRGMADDAMTAGFKHAMAKGVLDEGFWAQASRVGDELAPPGGVQGADRSMDGALTLLGAEIRSWFGATGDQTLARARASEFMKDPQVMAVATIYSAIDMNRDAFGLDPGEAKNAATVAGEIAAKGMLLSQLGPTAENNPLYARTRQGIAEGVGKLRKLGMDDTQISAVFESLENLGSNRTELLAQYTETADKTQFDLLDSTLSGMAAVGDQVQAVLIDEKLMKPVGGVVHDLSRFDMAKALENARKSIQYANDPQYAGFMGDLDAMRSMGLMTPEQEAEVRRILTEVPPELETLDPRVYSERAKAIGARQSEIGRTLAGGAEDERDVLESVIAEQQYLGGMDTQARLAELAQTIGVRP